MMPDSIDPVGDDVMQRARTPLNERPREAGRRARSPSPSSQRYPPPPDGTRTPVLDGATSQSAGRPGVMTDYEYTFRLMTVRRLERELMGTISKGHPMRALLLVLGFIALEVGLVTVTLQGNNTGIGENATDVPGTSPGHTIGVTIDFSVTLLSNLLGFLLLSVLLYCAMQTVPVIQWCLFEIAAGSIFLLIITPNGNRLQMIGPLGVFTDGGAITVIVGFIVLGLCFMTVGIWFAIHRVRAHATTHTRTPAPHPLKPSLSHAPLSLLCLIQVYPHAMRNGWVCLRDLNWFFRIQATPSAPGHYNYRIPMPFPLWLPCCGQDRTFGYEGEVDDEGKPHGLGTWTDNARHGECLQGVWQHGRPIGPFRGSEYHSDCKRARTQPSSFPASQTSSDL